VGSELAGRVIDVTSVVSLAVPAILRGRRDARVFLVFDDDVPESLPSLPTNAAHCPNPRLPASCKGGLPSGVLRRVREHVEQRLSESIHLPDLARIAGLSACHFARAFKQSTGMPPHRFLVSRRVERAKQLIRQTNRPMADIALDVGFADQSHFTRRFAAVTGSTPHAFRQRCR
jgi:transcriptional regulator GlxA family with amidase domain